MDRWAGRRTGGQTDGQTDKQRDVQTEGQTRRTNAQTVVCLSLLACNDASDYHQPPVIPVFSLMTRMLGTAGSDHLLVMDYSPWTIIHNKLLYELV